MKCHWVTESQYGFRKLRHTNEGQKSRNSCLRLLSSLSANHVRCGRPWCHFKRMLFPHPLLLFRYYLISSCSGLPLLITVCVPPMRFNRSYTVVQWFSDQFPFNLLLLAQLRQWLEFPLQPQPPSPHPTSPPQKKNPQSLTLSIVQGSP